MGDARVGSEAAGKEWEAWGADGTRGKNNSQLLDGGRGGPGKPHCPQKLMTLINPKPLNSKGLVL